MNARLRDLLGVLVVLAGLHIMTHAGARDLGDRIAGNGDA